MTHDASQTGARRFTARAPSEAVAEQVMAEAWAAGAEGIEERSDASGSVLIVYVPAAREREVRAAVEAFDGRGVSMDASEPVEAVDWTEAWKVGLVAIEVSPRLVVRPSFVAFELRPGQAEVVIDPGQAFGTGGHASTLLVLEWVDALLAPGGRFPAAPRVLDVGTGTGVLAMAALRLGARRAVGFDLDATAVGEAGEWARRNALADALALFAGPIEALRADPFDLVLVNLLKREVLPIASEVAECVAPGGVAIFSGLLEADRAEVVAAFEARGLRAFGEREILDATGDHWVSPALERPR